MPGNEKAQVPGNEKATDINPLPIMESFIIAFYCMWVMTQHQPLAASAMANTFSGGTFGRISS